jgi:solute carrier family 25 2-oxodicarboxylate transporter 21
MEAPKRATKFAANDSWGTFYKNLFGVEKMNQSLSVLTGATAGATEAFVVVPFELVKIRLQDRASAGRYNGAADAVAKIIREEGILAMYNGLEATLWRYACGDCADIDISGGMLGILDVSRAFVRDCPRQLQNRLN